jgi:hypothetical protein
MIKASMAAPMGAYQIEILLDRRHCRQVSRRFDAAPAKEEKVVQMTKYTARSARPLTPGALLRDERAGCA